MGGKDKIIATFLYFLLTISFLYRMNKQHKGYLYRMMLSSISYFGLFLVLCVFSSCSNDTTMTTTPTFDWQGHRGCRGLLPENTVPAFLKALDYNVKTLEMDAAISKDGKVIISHEPWFSAEISSKADGTPIPHEEEKEHAIRSMEVAKLQQYDVGSRGNERFPQQTKMKVHKPTLEEVVTAVNAYCEKNNHPQPLYNIEIKSKPEWDTVLAPVPELFAAILLKEINRLGIHDQSCIQSFDVRSLEATYAIDKKIVTAYLIENINPFQDNMKLLSFTPTIYSPYYQLVTDSLVIQTKAKNMQLIPWTINDVETMKKMKDMGVDGIITDYPNLISEVGL